MILTLKYRYFLEQTCADQKVLCWDPLEGDDVGTLWRTKAFENGE